MPASHLLKVQRECPDCGDVSFETSVKEQSFLYGTGADEVRLQAAVPIIRCLACGFEFTDERGEDLRHEAVCAHLGVLAPAQIVGLRHDLGLSQTELARLTGFGEASIKRWESGVLIQNISSDRFLRLLREPAALYKLRRLEDEREAARNRGNVVSLSARFRTPLEADVILRAPLFKLRIGGG